MRKLRSVLLVVLVLIPLQPAGFAQELDLEAFEQYARDTFAAYEVPGAGVAIVKDGRVVLAKGFGVRALGDPTPVDADTLFAIASCSKAFTTALIATLVDEGKIGWDDKIIDHLPDFRLYDPYVTSEFTVRDLLSHRSGIASQNGDLLWLRSTYTRKEIVHRIRFIEPDYSFRSRYGYQNIMYVAAGELIEAVSGKSWDALLAERIFQPLGMTSSSSTMRAREEGKNWATPHVRVKGVVQPIEFENVDNLGSAGAINASVNDLTRWLLLQLGRGKLGETRIFSEEQAAEMFSPNTIIPNGPDSALLAARQPLFQTYALAWRLKDYRGRKLVYHSGGLAGMTSLTTLVPQENLGIVILTNQETAAQTALTYWILDSYFGAPRTDWTSLQRQVAEENWTKNVAPKIEAVEKSRIPSTSPTLELSAYAGRYTDVLMGDALIEERDAGLRFRFPRSPAFDAPLEHWHYDTFVARFDHHSIADAFVTFVLGPDGEVAEMRMKRFSPAAESGYHYERLTFVPAARTD